VIIANTACLYWLSLFFKQRCTNDLKLERMDQCCYVRNVRRVQSDILWYIAYCDIIAILKIMQYDNCSSGLLQYCNNIDCPALSINLSPPNSSLQKSSTMVVLLYLYVLILQMYGRGWKGLISLLISAHALFCPATAATCTSPSKLPTLFSAGSVNGLLTQVLVCSYY